MKWSVKSSICYFRTTDLHKGFPPIGKWVGALLSEENKHQLFVPKGFAHGFCVLSDEVDFVYKCSDFYTPGDEYGINWNDPVIGIDWPMGDVVLADKDLKAPLLKEVSAGSLPN